MGREARQITVKKMIVCFCETGKKQEIVGEPTWEKVHVALCEIEKGNVDYILLSTGNDDGMEVFGEPHRYHIPIVDEKGMHYCYWNGLESTMKSVDLAGYSFPEHQICMDFRLLVKIVKYFYDTGERFGEVQWESLT